MSTNTSTNHKRLLIVEDDPATLKIYASKLRHHQLEVYSTSSGTEALLYLKKRHPHLVLLDLLIPGNIKGLDILKQIRSNPKLAHTPVFVLTNLESQVGNAQKLGATACYVKANTDIQDLFAAIDPYIH
jgi:CheY-like chemotaxis protein